MLNKLFSRIGRSISASGGGVVSACSQKNTSVPPSNPPYGTIIGSGSIDNQLNWTYSDSTGGLGFFTFGVTGYNVVADGGGGSFNDYVSYTETATYNQIIDDNIDGHPDYRIIYKGYNGSWSECHRVAATGNTSSGTSYIWINGTDIAAGTYLSEEFYDGLCGTYNNTNNSWYSYGTPLFGDSQYNYYSDGMGGYYTESTSPSYPSYGEFLYGDGGSSDVSWYAPDGSNGSWTYSSWGCSYYADGNGGSYSSCGGWSASSGTYITSGSWSDEGGTYYYTIYYDGNGGYYTT